MAASPRSFWKGHLRLSLVTIPVRLVTALRSDTAVSFHQVDRKTKQRVRYQKVVPGVGEVDKDDIVRGYEVEPGNYVLLEDEELDSLKLDTRHTIELTQFVDACEIDPLYFDRPYYLLPDGDIAEEGFRVIRQALVEGGKAGLGQLTLRGKENLVVLKPSGPGMLLETMRYAEEIKEAEDVFANIGRAPLPADLVKMAKTLIDGRSEKFDPQKFENHYARALRELVEAKVRTGKSVAVGDERADREPKVIDFMEALKRSLGAGASAGNSAPRSNARRQAARKTASKSSSTGERGGKSGAKKAQGKPARRKAAGR